VKWWWNRLLCFLVGHSPCPQCNSSVGGPGGLLHCIRCWFAWDQTVAPRRWRKAAAPKEPEMCGAEIGASGGFAGRNCTLVKGHGGNHAWPWPDDPTHPDYPRSIFAAEEPAAPKAEVRCEGCEKQQEAYNYTDDVRLCDECWNALPTMRKPAARRKGEPLTHAGENCWCSPRVEDYCGRKIVIHNEEQ